MRFEIRREPGEGLSLILGGYPYIAYHWLRWRLALGLGLRKQGRPHEGFQEHAQHYRSHCGELLIGWQPGHGLVLRALDEGAEALIVNEATRFLSRRYDGVAEAVKAYQCTQGGARGQRRGGQ